MNQATTAAYSALGTDPLKLPRLGCCHGVEDRWDERPEMQHTVGWRADENDAEGKDGDVLLELKAAVHGDKGIVVVAHEAQEVAVLDACPATADDCLDVVALKLSGEV